MIIPKINSFYRNIAGVFLLFLLFYSCSRQQQLERQMKAIEQERNNIARDRAAWNLKTDSAYLKKIRSDQGNLLKNQSHLYDYYPIGYYPYKLQSAIDGWKKAQPLQTMPHFDSPKVTTSH